MIKFTLEELEFIIKDLVKRKYGGSINIFLFNTNETDMNLCMQYVDAQLNHHLNILQATTTINDAIVNDCIITPQDVIVYSSTIGELLYYINIIRASKNYNQFSKEYPYIIKTIETVIDELNNIDIPINRSFYY